jgi:response regulator RpfG family c-di-GMP phosphodiesterase
MLYQNQIPLVDLPQVSRSKASILIVEDDLDTCEMMCLFFSRDYDCEGVHDGQKALDRIRTNRYSVILADLMMPKIDGYSVISSASILAPTTPVIVVSGVSETQSAIKAMRMGAFDYIVKPFEPDHVEMSIKRALSHHQMAEATRSYERRLAEYAAELEAVNRVLSTALSELDSNYHSTVTALAAAIETRNFDTRGHSDRVVAYSLKLGAALGLDEAEMKALELGALFHDIGKIGIEDRILLKPEALTATEWDQMRTHPEKGARIIAGIPYLRAALPVVLQHHERWDGTGYPAGVAGDEIDIKARIFAVADAFDAITSNRVYDGSRSFENARDELIRGAGKQFDPKIVETFCNIPLSEWAATSRLGR